MLFALLWADARYRRDWESAVALHARTLRFCVEQDETSTPRRDVVYSARFVAGQLRSRRESDSLPGGLSLPTPAASVEDSLRLKVDLERGELEVTAPLTTPETCCYVQLGDALLVTNDFRLAVRCAGYEWDEHGVYSLLQFGAVVPPRTVSRTVRRVPGGYRLRWKAGGDAPELQPACESLADTQAGEAAQTAVGEALDHALRGVERPTQLFFSGGVDSTLLALRWKKATCEDLPLLNVRLTADDAEADHARVMAECVGGTLSQFQFSPHHADAVIGRLGRDYAFPFADSSTLPTNALVHHAAETATDTASIIEGTGADGAFGMLPTYNRFARLSRMPRYAKRLLAHLYERRGWWQLPGTLRERLGRGAWRSLRMPPELAFAAQNALMDRAGDFPPDTGREVTHLLAEVFEPVIAQFDPVTRMSLIDLMFVCAGQFAQKSYHPLVARGLTPHYPFLSTALIEAAVAIPWAEKCTGGKAKSILKRMLLEEIPAEMVIRKKSGFGPPLEHLFTCPALQEPARAALTGSGSLLAAHLCQKTIVDMLDRAQRGQHLARSAYYFLWAGTFLQQWLDQLDFPAHGSLRNVSNAGSHLPS